MKIKIAALFSSLILLAAVANARTYNNCYKTDDPSAGLYFENGQYYPSANSSKHYFEAVTLVMQGQRVQYKIQGDSVFSADCVEQAGGLSSLTLSKDAYISMNKRFKCGDGKSFIQIKFDLNFPGSANGSVQGVTPDGRAFSFQLQCK